MSNDLPSGRLTQTPVSGYRRVRVLGQTAKRHLMSDRLLLLSVSCLVLLILIAALGPLVWRDSASGLGSASKAEAPSLSHPMGTDRFGRDVLARVMAGAKISLGFGAAIVFAGTAIGGAVGLIAGTVRGFTDSVLMRVMDSLLAFPAIVLAMAIAVGFGPGLLTSAVGVMVASVPSYARVIRSDVLRVASQPFVFSARALGASRRRVILRHVLPHVTPTVLILSTAAFGYTILAIAGLSFIGLGAQIPTPEWGAMITDGFSTALTGAWWVGVFPGIGLVLAVTATGLMADRLQHHFDPRHDL